MPRPWPKAASAKVRARSKAPNIMQNYFGDYFRDPDGNKLCVCCHDAPPPQ